MNNYSNGRPRLPRLALAFAAGLLVPIPAYPRPGGGGGYHSGGHSGGSHGFSSGGHGFSMGGHGAATNPGSSGHASWAVFLILAALALLGLCLLVGWLRRAPQRSGLEAPPGPGRGRASCDLESLRRGDPALTAAGLFQRTRQLAGILREAWCAGDMRPARALVSDGVFCRFSIQLGLTRAEGLRNVMSDARIVSVTVAGVESAAPLEIVHLRLDAEARDAMVALDASPGQITAALGHTPVQPYSEIWSLVRRQGARTRTGAVPIGRNCPSCGAALGQGEVIQCPYCRALVNSGEHDWVLAEITQLSAWHPAPAGAVPGFKGLREADPGLAVEVLEDRASYLFWKWVEACSTGSAAPLRPCATPAFLGAIPAAPALRGVAVGGVDLVTCHRAVTPDGMDRVVAKVYWSGAAGPGETGSARVHALRLLRRTGVRSEPSFSALLCRNCGAPLGASDSDRCAHCQAEVATGAQSWVLDGLTPA